MITFRSLLTGLLTPLLLAGCVSSGTGVALPLPLLNPDFEAPADLTGISGWSQSQHTGAPGEQAYEMVIDSVAAPQGSQSLKVTRKIPQVYGLVDQRISIPPKSAGKTMSISALMRTQEVGPGGWLLVVNMNSTGGIIEQSRSPALTGNVDWTRIDLRIPIPPGAISTNVGFLLLDSGTGWADDAVVRIE